jgi:hypothetical protein
MQRIQTKLRFCAAPGSNAQDLLKADLRWVCLQPSLVLVLDPLENATVLKEVLEGGYGEDTGKALTPILKGDTRVGDLQFHQNRALRC